MRHEHQTPTEQELSRFESEGGSTAAREESAVDRTVGLPVLDSDQRGRILLVYAARQPHLCVIADAIAARLRSHGFTVEIGDGSTGMMPPPEDYDAVVLGSPPVFGHQSRLIAAYIDDHRAALGELPSALFTVSKSGRPRDRDPAGFFERFSRTVGWQPDVVAAFAGGEPFPREGVMSRLQKWIGYRTRSGARDALRTDWTDVRNFADAIATELATAAVMAARTEPRVLGH